MDLIATSEPREFIPFYLGKKSNGQPLRASTGNRDSGDFPKCTDPNTAEGTVRIESTERSLSSSRKTSIQPPLVSLLLSAIKIIGSSGQGLIETSTDKDVTSQLSQSPDFSPF